MILLIQIFQWFYIIIATIVLLLSETLIGIIVAGNEEIVQPQFILPFIIVGLLIFLVVMLIPVLTLIKINQSKKTGKKADSLIAFGILNIISGDIVSGILLLLLEDKHFEKYYYEKHPNEISQNVNKATNIKYCTYCGQQLHIDDIYCRNCGKKQQ